MKHKVKVTVIDKNYIPNCNNSTAKNRIRACAPVIMSEMSSFLSGKTGKMILGISG